MTEEHCRRQEWGISLGFSAQLQPSMVNNDKPKLDKLQRKTFEDNNENGNLFQQGRLKRLGSVAWTKTRGRKQTKNVKSD